MASTEQRIVYGLIIIIINERVLSPPDFNPRPYRYGCTVDGNSGQQLAGFEMTLDQVDYARGKVLLVVLNRNQQTEAPTKT
jgi:hypothetical protein